RETARSDRGSWGGALIGTANRSHASALSGSKRLQRLRDLHVLLVAALVERELLLFDRVQPCARERRVLRRRDLVTERRRLQFVLDVMRAFPCQPFGGPLRVRGLQTLGAEGKRAAGRAIELREFG